MIMENQMNDNYEKIYSFGLEPESFKKTTLQFEVNSIEKII